MEIDILEKYPNLEKTEQLNQQEYADLRLRDSWKK